MIYRQNAAAMLLARRRQGLSRVVIYHPLSSALASLPTGQTVSIIGSNYEATAYQGIPCVRFIGGDDSNTSFNIPWTNGTYHNERNCTVSLWFARNGLTTNWRGCSFLGVGATLAANARGRFALFKKGGDAIIKCGAYEKTAYAGTGLVQTNDTAFHHICILGTVAGGATASDVSWSARIYLDGAYFAETNGTGWRNYNFDYVSVGCSGTSDTGSVYMAGLRVWNRRLTSAEITELAREFTPTNT